MHFKRLISLFLLLVLSACSHLEPPEWKLTPKAAAQASPGATAALTQAPAATSLPALPDLPSPTANPVFPLTANIPTTSPAPGAAPALDPLNLTKGLSGDPLSPSWSPDGKFIVFSLDDPRQSNHNQLYKAAVDGSGWTRLFDHPAANDFLPQWAPDGSKILFCSTAADGSGTNVFTVLPDGTQLTQLTHDHAGLCQAVWSPDASQIALISDRGDKPSGRLYVMKADGTNLHLVAAIDNSIEPVWSPAGDRLILSALDRDGVDAAMYSARPDGFGFIQLIKNPAFEAGMQWAPDGNKIIYQAASSLYMINPDSSKQVQILPTQTGLGGEAWSPNGAWIAFHAARAGDSQIFVATTDGVNRFYYAHPGLQDLFPLWSPDSKELLFYSHHDHVNDGALLLITFDYLTMLVK